MTKNASPENTDSINDVVTDLIARLDRQETEIANLRAQLGHEPHATTRAARPQSVSRADLLKIAGAGAVAATIAGFELSGPMNSAEASTGDSLNAGRVNKEENPTTLTYDGSSGGVSGAVFLANDSTYGNGPFNYPAVLAGVAGAGATAGRAGLSNGVHGYTDKGTGNGVVGLNTNAVSGSGGTGVLGVAVGATGNGVMGSNAAGNGVVGTSIKGSGVYGNAQSGAGVIGRSNSAVGVEGISTSGVGTSGASTSNHGVAGGSSTENMGGVYGNTIADTGGAGVIGTDMGVGYGGYFTSGRGTGLYAFGGVIAVQAEAPSPGIGVSGSGATGVQGTTSDSANGSSGVAGIANPTDPSSIAVGVSGSTATTGTGGAGVQGTHAGAGPGGTFSSASGYGVYASGNNGRGGSFGGKTANIRLRPNTAHSHPVSGQAGDLFVDKANRLWYCKKGGTKATWVQLG